MNLRRRMMMGGGGGSSPSGPFPGEVFGTSVQPLDVVFVDSSDEIHIIHGEENWPSNCTPIGVVLVPGSHNRYGNTSMHGVCALTSINNKSETGYIDPPSNTCFATGNYATYDTELNNYSNAYEDIENATIPWVNDAGVVYWSSNYNKIYFPYNQNGTVATPSDGALSDFSGEENTAVYASVSRASYDYVNIALNYSTAGTSAGDWYIPAAGELAYMLYYSRLLELVFDRITGVYSIPCGEVHFYDATDAQNDYTISSTEASSNSIWQMYYIPIQPVAKSQTDSQSALFVRIVK